MTGGALLGLILLSMAWLFSLAGLAFNILRKDRPLRYWPGVAGSLTVLLSLPAFPRLGIEVAWPWLWVLLPFVLDPGCVLTACRAIRARWRPPSG